MDTAEVRQLVEVDTTVVIIGAGSAGLVLAQGLKSANIPFLIFERDAATRRSREWGMSMHWGGDFLTNVLPPDLKARLKEIEADPHYDGSKDQGFVQCNGATGETILVMKGVMPKRISRQKLRGLLSEGIDIQHSKRLIDLSIDRVTRLVISNFSDGTTVTSRCLVGCDGSRSRVREIMLGDSKLAEPIPTDISILNFPYSYPTEMAQQLRAIHPVFKCSYHPTLNVMYLLAMVDAASLDPAKWRFQNLLAWAGPPYAADLETPASRVARCREIGAEFADPWKSAAMNIADDATLFVDRGVNWDPRKVFEARPGESHPDATQSHWNGNHWYGLITLAGDAAHTMLPHRGQGFNHALEDASRLLTALTAVFKDESKPLAAAITEYETEMVARGGGEVEVTGKQAVAAHNWEILMQSPIFKHGANKVK